MKRRHSLLAILLIAACSEPNVNLADAKPAVGAELDNYSREIERPAKLGRDASLLQRFCLNMSNAPCASDIADKLKAYGFVDDQSRVDLAHAFVAMAADAKDGAPDQVSSVDDFLFAAYRVVLGREPDEAGASDHRKFIEGAGDKKAVLQIMLQSAEFKALK